MKKSQHQIIRQQGVVIPLLAVSIFAVIAIIGLLNYRPRVHKLASAALREATTNLCRNLAANAHFQAEVQQQFEAEIATLQSSTALKDSMLIEDIEYAALTLPTMPDAPTSFVLSNSCDAGSGFTMPSVPLLPMAGCGIPSSQCLLITNPCFAKANSLLSWRYPAEFFRNYLHAGNTVGCEIRARVKNPIDFLTPSGNRTVTARVAYWRPVEGFRYTPYMPGGLADNASHAVTLVVAPQAQVPDFPFTGNNSRFSLSSAPGIDFTSFSPPGFSLNQLDISGKAGFSMAGNGTKQGGNYSNSSGTAVSTVYHDFTVPNPATYSDTLMSGCQNRPILVRNELLRSLTSLFQRNGTTRKNIIAYIAASQHRHRPASINSHLILPDRLNSPVLVSARRIDSTQRLWPAPSNFYYAGVANDPFYSIPAAFLSPGTTGFGDFINTDQRRAQGWIQPFSLAPGGANPLHGNTPQRLNYHSSVASQGAGCFHLYSTTAGIPYDPRRSTDYYHLRNFSAAFGFLEGIEYSYRLTTAGNQGYLQAGSANTPNWHQACYINILDVSPLGSSLEHVCRAIQGGMNLHEIFSTLGVWQQCSVDAAIFGDPLIQSCPVVNPVNDLRGDLVAALYAAAWNQLGSLGYDFDGSTNPSPPLAITPVVPKFSPGIAPLKENPPWSLDNLNARPLEAQHYVDHPSTGLAAGSWQATSGPIILVTHQPLLIPEREQLTTMVALLNALGRRVVIIYIPFHPLSSYPPPFNNVNSVLDSFRQVLGLSGGGTSINDFRALTPEHPSFVSAGLYTSLLDNQKYAAYWRDLLLPDPYLTGLSPTSQLDTNIWEIARSIYDKVVQHEAKL